jgi:hypothetical protein
MRILDIQSQNGFNDKSVTIEFTTEEQTIQGKALYYMICAIDKMKYKDYKDLSIMERAQVDNRLDAAIDFINEMRK